MARRRIHGMSTSTIALLGGGALLLYFITKPKAPTLTLPYAGPYAGGGQMQSSTATTTAAITQAGSIANNLINTIWG